MAQILDLFYSKTLKSPGKNPYLFVVCLPFYVETRCLQNEIWQMYEENVTLLQCFAPLPLQKQDISSNVFYKNSFD